MVRRVLLISAWALVTVSAAVGAWGAVSLAGEQVSDEVPRPLSAEEVAALPSIATSSAGPTTTSRPPTSTIAPPVKSGIPSDTLAPGTATTRSEPEDTASAMPPTTTRAPTAAPSTTIASPPTTAASAPVTPPTTTTSAPVTPPTTTATTTTPPVSATVSTYHLVGGSVAIATLPETVNLVWATPNPGFTVEVDSAGPESVSVEFSSGSHESDFEALWSDGELQVSSDEQAEGEGGES